VPVLRRTRTELIKSLSRDEVQQKVIRLPRADFLPEPDLLFDVWHDGVPWASKIRSEPCTCGRPPGPHRHQYIEGGELHAGLRWAIGARLKFRAVGDRIEVSGDLDG
jgi:hypothetical protein